MLGLRLKTARITHKMSIADLSKKFAIKQVYLTALEEENFAALPPPVYTLGYIKILADYFNLHYEDLKSEYEVSQMQGDGRNSPAYQIKIQSHNPRNYFLLHSLGGIALFVMLLFSFYSIVRATGFLFLETRPPSKDFHPFVEDPTIQPLFSPAGPRAVSSEISINRLLDLSQDLNIYSKNISISTTQDCWLWLKNPRNNEDYFSGIFRVSDDPISFQVTLPLQVYATNALSISISIDGKPYRFSKNIVPNNTARFTIQ